MLKIYINVLAMYFVIIEKNYNVALILKEKRKKE